MTEINDQRIARQIREKLDVTNVNEVFNCMTRVRVNLKAPSQVDPVDFQRIEGVLGSLLDGNQLQVIVGPGKAEKVASELGNLLNKETFQVNENLDPDLTASVDDIEIRTQTNKAAVKSQQKQSGFRNALNVIANIFVPLIPAFVGAGIIGGIASIFQNLITAESISAETWGSMVTVLNIIKNGLFGYLNIYIGINAAKSFGATQSLGGVVGGIVYLTGMNPDNPLINVFTGQPLAPGQGGVIGVVLAVYLLSIIERQLKKIVPDSLDIIVTPTLSLLIVGLITIYLIMPVAGFVSNGLVGAINWVLEVGGPFAGFVLGATFLPLVMFGLHQILTPVHIEMIASQGKTTLLPILAMAGAGQVGAALALWLKTDNKRLKEIIKGSLPVGILGIGEPLIYAVTLPLGRPFLTACLGGGVGGAIVAGIGGVGATAIGPSGIALIPLIADGQWLQYVIGLIGAYIGGFIFTYLFGYPAEDKVNETFAVNVE